jgi:hypothetical protein
MATVGYVTKRGRWTLRATPEHRFSRAKFNKGYFGLSITAPEFGAMGGLLSKLATLQASATRTFVLPAGFQATYGSAKPYYVILIQLPVDGARPPVRTNSK